MDKTDVNRICDIDNLVSTMSEVQTSVINVVANLRECQKDLKKVSSNYSDMEVKSERNNEEHEEKFNILTDIIDKAESWDYGIKGWRTLETKQDLINAIKKEVLNV